jgi:hypothetical protein
MRSKTLLTILFLAATVGYARAEPSLKVLFVGNSYTYVNDLPKMVSQLAAADGRRLEAETDAPGGMTLVQHSKNAHTVERIQKGHWNWVVLQDQSQTPAFPAQQLQTAFYPGVRTLNTAVLAAGAKPLLYMTWGHKDGDPGNFPRDNYTAMQLRLRHGYENIARPLSIRVAPVGLAWQSVVGEQPALALWQGDGSHPTPIGTYLAACVIYQCLFNRSPVGNTFTAGLDPKTVHLCQESAATVNYSYPYSSI